MAALQAITIYILFRLSENNEEVTNFDIPLTYTMMVCEPGISLPEGLGLIEAANHRTSLFKRTNKLSDTEQSQMATHPFGGNGS